jgi:predicted transcriptional regulator
MDYTEIQIDYTELQKEFKKTIQEIAKVTGRTEDEIKTELENTENMAELIKKASEIFNE